MKIIPHKAALTYVLYCEVRRIYLLHLTCSIVHCVLFRIATLIWGRSEYDIAAQMSDVAKQKCKYGMISGMLTQFTSFKKSPCLAFRKIFASWSGVVVVICKWKNLFQTYVSMKEQKKQRHVLTLPKYDTVTQHLPILIIFVYIKSETIVNHLSFSWENLARFTWTSAQILSCCESVIRRLLYMFNIINIIFVAKINWHDFFQFWYSGGKCF